MSARSESDIIGARVRVRPVGKKEAFDGIVREAWYHGGRTFSGTYYHVEDTADGSLWHRTSKEFEVVQ